MEYKVRLNLKLKLNNCHWSLDPRYNLRINVIYIVR